MKDMHKNIKVVHVVKPGGDAPPRAAVRWAAATRFPWRWCVFGGRAPPGAPQSSPGPGAGMRDSRPVAGQVQPDASSTAMASDHPERLSGPMTLP